MSATLQARGVAAAFGDRELFTGLDLVVASGDVVGLVGANGAGKSTTLNVICGIVPPTKGDVVFLGRSIRRLGSDKIVGLGISQVPEGREIFRDMSVHDFDLIRWLTGQEIVEVYARGTNNGDPAIRAVGDVDTALAAAEDAWLELEDRAP